MAITFVNNLGLSEMGTGDNSGTWGNVTNVNLELIGQALGHGTRVIADASQDNITMSEGTADDDRALYLKLTGGGQACTVTLLPATMSKVWIMENGTAAALTFTQGSGANVVIPAGDTKVIACTGGAGTAQIVYDVFTDLNLAGTTVVDDLTVTDDVAIGGILGVTGVLTTTAATVFNGGFTANDGSIITTADTDAHLTLISTDAGTGVAPLLVFNRNSSTPADNDQLGKIQFIGEDDGDNATIYSQIVNQIRDVTGGEEDGRMAFNVISAGADKSFINMTHDGAQAEVVINDESIDMDFRVEGNNHTHAIFLQGSSDRVGINESSPDTILHISDSSAPTIRITNTDTTGNVDQTIGEIQFEGSDSSTDANGVRASIEAEYGGVGGFTRLKFATAGENSTTLIQNLQLTTGSAVFNEGSADVDFRVESDGNANMLFVDGGNNRVAVGTNNPSADFVVSNGGAAGIELQPEHSTDTNRITNFDRAASAYMSFKLDALNHEFQTSGTTRLAIAADGAVSTPTAGTSNTRLGVSAGDAIVADTSFNVLIGDEAGTDLNSGDSNVGVGYKALFEANSGSNNVAVGTSAMRDLTSGSLNVAVGEGAMFNGVVTGNSNIALGYLPLQDLTGGIGNIAIGRAALGTLTSGNNSVAIGYEALNVNNNSEITSVGNFSGLNSTGGAQVFVGYSAGKFVTSGASNVFVGHNAAKGLTSVKTTGSNNTCVGSGAGLVLQGAGNANTFLGSDAGDSTTTGARNIFIGVNANSTSATGNHAICIGHDITAAAQDFSFGRASNVVTNDFDADANWSRSSDERLKKNITNQSLGLDFINDLRTVKYNWKPSDELDANDAQLAHLRREDEDGNIINEMNTDVLMHNFIAQEVKAALDTAGVSEFGGWKEDHHGVQQVSREMFVIPLVKAVQELSTALDAALARITTLEG